MTNPINDELTFETIKFYRETDRDEKYMVLHLLREDGKGVAVKINRDNLVREIVKDFMNAISEFTESLVEGVRDI